MNNTAKTTTTRHAAPGFLAQAGVMDKTLSPLEVYELHVRLKYLKDPTIDKANYLIDPHLSEEKYIQSIGFTNSIDIGAKQILNLARQSLKSEKIKTNVGPGEIENQSQLFFVSSKNGLEVRAQINVRSEKIVPFEPTTNEGWAY